MTRRLIRWTAAGQERDRDQDRVCFYQDIQFRGWEQCYAPGDEVIDLRDRKNAISSIRTFGRARVIIYDENQFRGPSLEINSDVPDLDLRSMSGSRSWNDRISSIQVSGNAVAMLYENIGFQGERLVIDRDISNLAVIRLRDGVNWNDQGSSLEVREDRGRGPNRR